jgi:hypothetical protein
VFMPWGKYRGQHLSSVPDSYLRWVLREADAAEPWLRAAIGDELRRRGYRADSDREQPRDHAGPRHQPPADLRSVITRWYRELALRYHPDRTLDNGAAMKAINHGYERLQELLGIA